MRVVGMDPGQSGGLACLSPQFADARVMPLLPKEAVKAAGSPIDWAEIHSLLLSWAPDVVTIERVSAMPGQGVSSTFRFGSNYGGLIGLVRGLCIPYKLVVPRVWKRDVLGEDFPHDKAGTIAFVQKHYPSLNLLATKRSRKPHDGMADATAIAHYGITKLQDSVS
jgi:crossover junction endodeoxyribonuclease RuvC